MCETCFVPISLSHSNKEEKEDEQGRKVNIFSLSTFPLPTPMLTSLVQLSGFAYQESLLQKRNADQA